MSSADRLNADRCPHTLSSQPSMVLNGLTQHSENTDPTNFDPFSYRAGQTRIRAYATTHLPLGAVDHDQPNQPLEVPLPSRSTSESRLIPD